MRLSLAILGGMKDAIWQKLPSSPSDGQSRFHLQHVTMMECSSMEDNRKRADNNFTNANCLTIFREASRRERRNSLIEHHNLILASWKCYHYGCNFPGLAVNMAVTGGVRGAKSVVKRLLGPWYEDSRCASRA